MDNVAVSATVATFSTDAVFTCASKASLASATSVDASAAVVSEVTTSSTDAVFTCASKTSPASATSVDASVAVVSEVTTSSTNSLPATDAVASTSDV